MKHLETNTNFIGQCPTDPKLIGTFGNFISNEAKMQPLQTTADQGPFVKAK